MDLKQNPRLVKLFFLETLSLWKCWENEPYKIVKKSEANDFFFENQCLLKILLKIQKKLMLNLLNPGPMKDFGDK